MTYATDPGDWPSQHFRCSNATHAAIGYIQTRDNIARAEVLRRLLNSALDAESLNDPVIAAIVLEDNR